MATKSLYDLELDSLEQINLLDSGLTDEEEQACNALRNELNALWLSQ